MTDDDERCSQTRLSLILRDDSDATQSEDVTDDDQRCGQTRLSLILRDDSDAVETPRLNILLLYYLERFAEAI